MHVPYEMGVVRLLTHILFSLYLCVCACVRVRVCGCVCACVCLGVDMYAWVLAIPAFIDIEAAAMWGHSGGGAPQPDETAIPLRFSSQTNKH